MKKTAVGVYTQSSAKDGTLASYSTFLRTRIVTGSDESSGVRHIDTGGTGEEGWDESSGVRCIETGRAGVEGWGETAGGYSSRDGNLNAAVLDGYDAAPGHQMLFRRTRTERILSMAADLQQKAKFDHGELRTWPSHDSALVPMLELLMAHLRQARDKSYGRENLGWTIGFTPGLLPRHCRERTNYTIWQKCVEVGHLYVTRHNSNSAGLHTIPRGGMNKQSVWEDEGGIFTVICTTDHGIHTKTTLEGSEPSNVKCQGRRAPDTKDERTERSLNVRVVRMDKVQEKDRLSLTECRWGSDDADTKRLICDSPRLHLAYDKTEGCTKGAYRLNDEGAIFTFVRTVDDWIHTKTISKGSEPLEGCQVSEAPSP
ncbi:hypothetical protein EDD15DRAFT_2201668 [Pisolithus albus]|nr:hypothetical protein EDD15DRAFT_2201668 [Pisolithus albus]